MSEATGSDVSLEELYSAIAHDEAGLEAALARVVPTPRPPEVLLEKLYALGVGAGDVVLDVGCASGTHSFPIAAATGCAVVGVDVTQSHLVEAYARAGESADEGARGRLGFARGSAEVLPVRSGSMDYVWCRDMLYHVDLRLMLGEFARVLRPGGHAVTYHSFATEWLEAGDRERLAGPMHWENMEEAYFERCVAEAGFAVLERDVIGSEWRELWEGEDGRTSSKLLRAARIVRGGEALRREIGEVAYAIHLADCLWGVYQMIGKLRPVAYVLGR